MARVRNILARNPSFPLSIDPLNPHWFRVNWHFPCQIILPRPLLCCPNRCPILQFPRLRFIVPIPLTKLHAHIYIYRGSVKIPKKLIIFSDWLVNFFFSSFSFFLSMFFDKFFQDFDEQISMVRSVSGKWFSIRWTGLNDVEIGRREGGVLAWLLYCDEWRDRDADFTCKITRNIK